MSLIKKILLSTNIDPANAAAGDVGALVPLIPGNGGVSKRYSVDAADLWKLGNVVYDSAHRDLVDAASHGSDVHTLSDWLDSANEKYIKQFDWDFTGNPSGSAGFSFGAASDSSAGTTALNFDFYSSVAGDVEFSAVDNATVTHSCIKTVLVGWQAISIPWVGAVGTGFSQTTFTHPATGFAVDPASTLDAGMCRIDTVRYDQIVTMAIGNLELAGTAQAAAPSSLTLAAGASEVEDAYAGMQVIIQGGTGAGQVRNVVASRKNGFRYSADASNAVYLKYDCSAVGDIITVTGTTDPRVSQGWNTGSAVGGRTFTLSVDLWIEAGQRATGYLFYMYDAALAYVSTQPVTITQVRTRYTFIKTINASASATSVVGRLDMQTGFVIGNTLHAADWQIEEGVPSEYIETTSVGAVGAVIDTPWDTPPDATSTYALYSPPAVLNGVQFALEKIDPGSKQYNVRLDRIKINQVVVDGPAADPDRYMGIPRLAYKWAGNGYGAWRGPSAVGYNWLAGWTESGIINPDNSAVLSTAMLQMMYDSQQAYKTQFPAKQIGPFVPRYGRASWEAAITGGYVAGAWADRTDNQWYWPGAYTALPANVDYGVVTIEGPSETAYAVPATTVDYEFVGVTAGGEYIRKITTKSYASRAEAGYSRRCYNQVGSGSGLAAIHDILSQHYIANGGQQFVIAADATASGVAAVDLAEAIYQANTPHTWVSPSTGDVFVVTITSIVRLATPWGYEVWGWYTVNGTPHNGGVVHELYTGYLTYATTLTAYYLDRHETWTYDYASPESAKDFHNYMLRAPLAVAQHYYLTESAQAKTILDNWLAWLDVYIIADGAYWQPPSGYGPDGNPSYAEKPAYGYACIAAACIYKYWIDGDALALTWYRRMLDTLYATKRLTATGSCAGISRTTEGSGYTTATVDFTVNGGAVAPTATAIIAGGKVVRYTVDTPGSGITSISATITGDGIGATCNPYLSDLLVGAFDAHHTGWELAEIFNTYAMLVNGSKPGGTVHYATTCTANDTAAFEGLVDLYQRNTTDARPSLLNADMIPLHEWDIEPYHNSGIENPMVLDTHARGALWTRTLAPTLYAAVEYGRYAADWTWLDKLYNLTLEFIGLHGGSAHLVNTPRPSYGLMHAYTDMIGGEPLQANKRGNFDGATYVVNASKQIIIPASAGGGNVTWVRAVWPVAVPFTHKGFMAEIDPAYAGDTTNYATVSATNQYVAGVYSTVIQLAAAATVGATMQVFYSYRDGTVSRKGEAMSGWPMLHADSYQGTANDGDNYMMMSLYHAWRATGQAKYKTAADRIGNALLQAGRGEGNEATFSVPIEEEYGQIGYYTYNGSNTPFSADTEDQPGLRVRSLVRTGQTPDNYAGLGLSPTWTIDADTPFTGIEFDLLDFDDLVAPRGSITYIVTIAGTPAAPPLTGTLNPGDVQVITLPGYAVLEHSDDDLRSMSKSVSGVVETRHFLTTRAFKFEVHNVVEDRDGVNYYAILNALNDEIALGTVLTWCPDYENYPADFYYLVGNKRLDPTRVNKYFMWNFKFDVVVLPIVQYPSTIPTFVSA